MAGAGDAEGMLQHLLHRSHLTGPDDLPALAADGAARLGAAQSALYLVDYDQVVLVPLAEGAADAELGIEGTVAGRCYTDVAPYQVAAADGGTTLWLPLLDGTERLGVVRLDFPAGADPEPVREACAALATLLAELVVSRSDYGDRIEQIRRRLPMSLAAELQWTQLPPLTFATSEVTVTGVLAPTHEVAGDSFDYALNGDVLHVVTVDAMGHGLEAALMSIVAIGALRNARRIGLDLVDAVMSADRQLEAQFGTDKFVTAVVGELHVRTGMWRWVAAGHPPALLVRNGRVVKSMTGRVSLPLGLQLQPPAVEEERLEPGDRLLLHSDGVVEARDASGEFFGEERLVELVTKEAAAGRPAAETLRRLNLAILAHQGGELQDDATTLLVEWRGEHQGG